MKPRKKTGELELFKKIWEERPHKCTICDVRLPWFAVSLFAHVLGKGTEPAARLDKENILLMCYPHHYHYDHETSRAADDERYNKVFELKDEIRAKYNGKKE